MKPFFVHTFIQVIFGLKQKNISTQLLGPTSVYYLLLFLMIRLLFQEMGHAQQHQYMLPLQI
jgi:hypothetical protein